MDNSKSAMFSTCLITLFLLLFNFSNWTISNAIKNKTPSRVRRHNVGVDLIRRQKAEPMIKIAWGGYKAVNKSKREILKTRVRRATGDGLGPPARKPVELKSCLCPFCVDEPGAFKNGSWENVAFNKPANASSTLHDSGQRLVGPCGALNGNTSVTKSNIDSPRPNCYSSQVWDYFPWWIVDLEFVYTFKTITLIISTSRLQLSDVLFTVDGRVCKQTDSYQAFRQITYTRNDFVLECTQMMTGRYVRVQKHVPRNLTSRDYYNFFVAFCELQIWVCKPWMFGQYPSACQPCPDRCRHGCNNVYGCTAYPIKQNVAILKTVTQSSGFANRPSHYLTDGRSFYTRVYLGKTRETRKYVTTQSSRTTVLHWITVALESTFVVERIDIHSRADCCSKFLLRNFKLLVTQTDAQKFEENLEVYTCASEEGEVPTDVARELTCSTPLTGRYVHVIKRDTKALSLSELKAWGYPRYQLVPGAACTDYSEVAVCVEGSRCVDSVCRIEEHEDCTPSNEQHCMEGLSCHQGVCAFVRELKQSCHTGVCVPGLMCDDSSKTCRQAIGGPCSSDAECQTGVVCDALSTCRLKVGHECQEDLECPAGARCTQSHCACDTGVSVQEGDLCRPSPSRMGSSCSTDDDCISTSCENQVCNCIGNQTITRQFGCKLSAGASCDDSKICNEGLQCELSVCKIKIGLSCHQNSDLCIYSATCEDDVCKPKLGFVCVSTFNNIFDSGKDYCSGNLVCSDSICKHRLGDSCLIGGPHCAHSVCSDRDNYTCKLDVGQSCASDISRLQTQCRTGTFCQDETVCKVDIRQQCDNTRDCRDGSTCGPRAGSGSGSATKRCRLPLGAAGCTNDEDCVDSTVCDLQRRCRMPKNGACQSDLGTCLVGAVCTDEGICQCNPEATDAASDKCDPKPGKAGGKCMRASTCEGSAVCIRSSSNITSGNENSTCQCQSPYAISLEGLTCGIKAGFPCKEGGTNSDASPPCIPEAACVHGLCTLKVGAQCRGDRQSHCQLDSVCDTDGTCRFNIHQSCLNNTEGCRLGTACDSLHRCRRKPGQECTEDGVCMAGSQCSQEGQCECTPGVTTPSADICLPEDGVVGGKCQGDGGCRNSLASCSQDTGLCECQRGYSGTHVGLECAKDLEQECAEDGECVSGLVCDPIAGRCRIQLGQICDMGNERMCATGLACDFDYVCKLGLEGNCSGDSFALCKSGTFCDWLGECKVGVGAACDKPGIETKDPCPAGAKCVDSVCLCDLELAQVYGIICKPNVGRYGGSCQAQCTVHNSQCVDNVCQCKENFKPDSFFNCVGNKPKFSSGTNLWTVLGIIGIVALLLLLVILFLAVRVRRRLHKRTELTRQRAQSLHALTMLEEIARELEKDEASRQPSPTQATASEVPEIESSTDTGSSSGTVSEATTLAAGEELPATVSKVVLGVGTSGLESPSSTGADPGGD